VAKPKARAADCRRYPHRRGTARRAPAAACPDDRRTAGRTATSTRLRTRYRVGPWRARVEDQAQRNETSEATRWWAHPAAMRW
jgi:hypothetical protein